MVIARLTNSNRIEDKLKSILDDAKLRKDEHIVILTEQSFHTKVFNFFLKHKAIEGTKLGGDTLFMIKEMRIELKPITYTI
tara:strand:- start:13013 stop:13255 length:243 start_codon:yes stop_codon:yes gene_type:complete